MTSIGNLFLTVAITFFLSIGQTKALTLKTGEVLGSDGNVYSGASPEQLLKMEKTFKDSGKNVQVFGHILFVDILRKAVSISLKEIQSKQGADLDEFIDEKIESALAIGNALDKAKDTAKDKAKQAAKDAATDTAKKAAKEVAKKAAKEVAKKAAKSAAKKSAKGTSKDGVKDKN